MQKFVCTTIRPAQLPFQDFYTHEGCARFVADYLRFESLSDPEEPVRSKIQIRVWVAGLTSLQPMYMVSPATLLEMKAGEPFDYATLLCSLLIGAGYDAYVVYGYATKRMTLKDEERIKHPPIRHETEDAPPLSPAPDTKYKPSALPTLSSKFLAKQGSFHFCAIGC